MAAMMQGFHSFLLKLDVTLSLEFIKFTFSNHSVFYEFIIYYFFLVLYDCLLLFTLPSFLISFGHSLHLYSPFACFFLFSNPLLSFLLV